MSAMPNSSPAGVFSRIVGALPINQQHINPKAVRMRKWTIWHRQAYAAAGAVSFSFFNAAKSRFVTNLAQAGQMTNGYWFAAESIGLRVVPGVDMAGAAAATGASAVADAATMAAYTLAEQMRLINSSGLVTFKVNGVAEVEEWGLDAFPVGRGLDGAAAGATTDTTISASLGIFNNGVPALSNKRKFDPLPVPIEPGAAFGLDVEFPAALPLTGGGVFECFLEGTLVSAPAIQ